jgi:excinuclease ABC subunit A
VVVQLEHLYDSTKSEFTKKRLRMFQGKRVCRVCLGQRLRPEILAVTVAARDGREFGIQRVCQMTIDEAAQFLDQLQLSAGDQEIVKDVLREICQRLRFLKEVGLGYLQLNRESGTLSGGEAQRIRLAPQIGSGLSGVLYVLDEPSIGLHQRDNDQLIQTLRNLRELGNSVIVVEHDEDTIRAADHILDIGPGAGPSGGTLVAQGTLAEILHRTMSAELPDGWRRKITLIDDGSSPQHFAGVLTTVTALKQAGEPIEFIKHEVNKGKGAALQTGFDANTGIAVQRIEVTQRIGA